MDEEDGAFRLVLGQRLQIVLTLSVAQILSSCKGMLADRRQAMRHYSRHLWPSFSMNLLSTLLSPGRILSILEAMLGVRNIGLQCWPRGRG